MYERSAIVLERYMEKILKLDKANNLKKNSENYNELIHEIENYQNVTEKELEIIQEFDDIAKEIEHLQDEQGKLYKANKRLEEERAQLFTELGEEAEVLEIKLKRIEETLEKNNEKLRDIRIEFIKLLADFSKKQKNRNRCEKARRIGEANHISYIEKMSAEFQEIDVKDVVSLKDFINFEKDQIKQEALNIMVKNGKSERIAFNEEVLKRAIKTRIDIAEKEAECYILVYDKMKKLLAEPDSEAIRLNKYKKTFRDTSVKLAFLNAEREYIVSFLDYERMTAISGARAHKKMMMEACNNFELDIMQIDNLYELIMREINNRSTKKAYNQLYNKTYLKHIEDKEKNFQQEVNTVNISTGTVINSNYWRIDGIKNIYNVFQAEVSEKFEKDLSEYRLEEPEEIEEMAKVNKYKNYNKQEKEESYKQFKYDEYGKYDEYDYDDQEEDDEEEKTKNNSYSYSNKGNYVEEEDDDTDSSAYQYRIDDYNFGKKEEKDNDNYNYNFGKEEEDNNDYDYNYNENDEEDVEETYEEYEEEDDYEEQEEYYEEDSYEDEYDNQYEENSYEDDYKNEYEEEEEDDKDNYKAYNKNAYLEDDEDDDEYANIYEYNYENDEEEYRKQRLKNKTVISFDDEESIDMIIANSRKRATTNRKNNNKGLFNKLFKK